MNRIAEHPVVQLKLTRSVSTRNGALRPAKDSRSRSRIAIPGLGKAGRGGSHDPITSENAVWGLDDQPVVSMEDLPIALRIAAVARHHVSGSSSDPEPRCDLAAKDKELIDGLVRVLSRGQDRVARP